MSAAPAHSRVSLAKKRDLQTAANPSSAPTARVDSLALVMARNSFYSVNFQKILYIVLGQIVGIGIMLSVVVRLFEFTDSRDYYFPVQTDNTLILERPLYEPVYSDEEIRMWAEKAVTETLTFGHYDYLMRWQESRSFFTIPGWASFNKAMADVHMIDQIGGRPGTANFSNPQVVFTQVHPGEHAEIVRQGRLGAFYAWDVTMPVDISFFDKTKQYHKSWKIDLRIVRMPTRESRYGKGISQLIAEDVK